MSTETYRTNGWKQLEIFEEYNRARNYTKPARIKTAQEIILPNIPKEGVVLEYGAGIGELRHGLIGDALPKDVTWIETEQNPDYLNAHRAYKTQKQVANLKALPFPDESADLLTGYGVLDTIPSEMLPSALTELYRVCKTGGKLIEQLDLGIDSGEIFIKAEERGEVPFFSFSEISPGILGQQKIFFVNKKDLEKMINTKSKDPNFRLKLPMFQLYLKNPLESVIRLQQKGSTYILVDLAKTVKKANLVKGEEISLIDYYRTNLEEASRNAGFEIESSGNVRNEIIINKRDLAELPPEKNTVLYRNGSSYFTNDRTLRDPSKVKLDVSTFVFVARKGLQPTS